MIRRIKGRNFFRSGEKSDQKFSLSFSVENFGGREKKRREKIGREKNTKRKKEKIQRERKKKQTMDRKQKMMLVTE